MRPLAIAHGGAAAPAGFRDGTERAARAAFDLLLAGGSALDAAVLGATLLEDDPRFNAGTGSNLRFDGRTIEMDASLMDSEGTFGAVIGLKRAKNPILVARDVTRTPHLMLSGEGAVLFARRMGHADYDPLTARAVEKHRRAIEKWKALREGAPATGEGDPHPGWLGCDPRLYWNFPEEFRAGDTIGVVARDSLGRFAVTNSTGGTALMLHGRVGDSPIFGAGLYAGPAGAVAATGEGEEIVRRLLCYEVYRRIEGGAPAEEACRAELERFPDRIAVGLIAADRNGAWGGSHREMPFSVVDAST
jgi:L-asparaginase/beta-aspartyl-peptidase (threonine type)